MLEAGQEVDRYQVEQLCGEGGMARVYRVRHTTLGSLHALKILHLHHPSLFRRLIDEGRTQATLRHPNVVAVTDVVEVDGLPGIVMEWVEGGTLEDWLAEEPPRAERLRVFALITQAVAAAHARGWVHRDLKPANVLMDRSVQPIAPKVADFGLVKALDPDLAPGRTRAGAVLGTPGYLAPEQAVDASSVDARADVFSLGCLLVKLLTGEDAVPGATALAQLARLGTGEFRGLPDDDPLAPLARSCLAPDREDRPADAGVLGAQLASALTSRTPAPAPAPALAPALAPAPNPAGAPVRSRSPARAGLLIGALFTTAALGALTCAGLLALFAWPRSTESDPAATDPPLVPQTPCPHDTPERLGYAATTLPTTTAVGAVIRLEAATEVLADASDPASGRCTLPAGTGVVVRERVRKGWLAVYGDGLLRPGEDLPDKAD